ncbi:MAG: hypothetical protein ACI85O_002293 [Saprospiraceae bacterium]|jgi:hypothetical protein
MSNKSPFAKFYDNVFKTASASEQEAFLRELFTKDAALGSSFYNFISPNKWDPVTMENFNIEIKKNIRTLQQQTRDYKWDILWDRNDNPESYADDLIKILDAKFVGFNQFPIRSMCANGELLDGLASLRVIEMGLNIDWEKTEEPALYYGPEVGFFIVDQFEGFYANFIDYVFSVTQIKAALEMIKVFKMKPGAFFNNNEEWENVEDLLREEIAGRVV